MKSQEFHKLGMGDVIKYRGRGRNYLVVQNDGVKIKAVSVIEDIYPENWEVVAKANYPIESIKIEKLIGS